MPEEGMPEPVAGEATVEPGSEASMEENVVTPGETGASKAGDDGDKAEDRS